MTKRPTIRARSTLRQIIHDNQRQLLHTLQRFFVAIPRKECECGERIVFPWPHKKNDFTCPKCGKEYLLVVRVDRVITKQITKQ